MNPGDQIRTPLCRLSFPALFTPKPPMTLKPNIPVEQQLKYSVVGLFPFAEQDKLEELNELVWTTAKAKWQDPKILDKLVLPFVDGNTKDRPEFEDNWVVQFSSKFKPLVVDRANNEIHAEGDVYAGCWGLIICSAFCWSWGPLGSRTATRWGVSLNLHGVMKVKDDTPLVAGREANRELFAEVAETLPESPSSESGGVVIDPRLAAPVPEEAPAAAPPSAPRVGAQGFPPRAPKGGKKSGNGPFSRQ